MQQPDPYRCTSNLKLNGSCADKKRLEVGLVYAFDIPKSRCGHEVTKVVRGDRVVTRP